MQNWRRLSLKLREIRRKKRKTLLFRLIYVIWLGNTADNGFRAKECRMIMKVQFINLKALLLSISDAISEQNQIGDKGCKYLSKSSWPNLTELSLGIFSIH